MGVFVTRADKRGIDVETVPLPIFTLGQELEGVEAGKVTPLKLVAPSF